MSPTRPLSDDELIERVASAGRSLPAHAGGLDGVGRRARRRRTRRRAVSGSLAVALAATMAALVVTSSRQDESNVVVADGALQVTAPDALAGTRIVVGAWALDFRAVAGVGSVDDGRLRELRRAGKGESVIDVAGVDGSGSTSGADGGVYVLTSRSTGGTREDGPGVEGLQYPLLRLDAAGRVLWEKDVRIVGEYVRMVAATADRVVLRRWVAGRPSTLFELDLHTGAERRLATIDGEPMPGAFAGDELLVPVNRERTCSVLTIDAAGSVTGFFDVPQCQEALALEVDRSGRTVAVAFQSFVDGSPAPFVSVIDRDSPTRPRLVTLDARRGDLVGFAWQPDGRLMAAFVDRSSTGSQPVVAELDQL